MVITCLALQEIGLDKQMKKKKKRLNNSNLIFHVFIEHTNKTFPVRVEKVNEPFKFKWLNLIWHQ